MVCQSGIIHSDYREKFMCVQGGEGNDTSREFQFKCAGDCDHSWIKNLVNHVDNMWLFIVSHKLSTKNKQE